jgi:hypothetical protein
MLRLSLALLILASHRDGAHVRQHGLDLLTVPAVATKFQCG